MTHPSTTEAMLQAHYTPIRQRLMNPKNGIQEPKVARVQEERPAPAAPVAPAKPSGWAVSYETALQIKALYYAGVPIKKIMKQVNVGQSTISDVRNRYGWPVRERVRK